MGAVVLSNKTHVDYQNVFNTKRRIDNKSFALTDVFTIIQ